MAGRDPYYIVKDEVAETVRARERRPLRAAPHAVAPPPAADTRLAPPNHPCSCAACKPSLRGGRACLAAGRSARRCCTSWRRTARALSTWRVRARPPASPRPLGRSLPKAVPLTAAAAPSQVAEIDKSIDAAERNPQRFNLSQAELSDRRKWVMGTRRQLGSMTSGLSAAAGGGGDSTPPSAAGRLAAAVHEENDRFIGSEGDRQQLMMQ